MNVDVCASSSDERWVARLVCMRHEVRQELDHTKHPIGLSCRSVDRHSMTGLAIAGGSRPAMSHPAAAATSGTPTTARTR
jgi:hypothetical protein